MGFKCETKCERLSLFRYSPYRDVQLFENLIPRVKVIMKPVFRGSLSVFSVILILTVDGSLSNIQNDFNEDFGHTQTHLLSIFPTL